MFEKAAAKVVVSSDYSSAPQKIGFWCSHVLGSASFLKIFEGQQFRETAPVTPEHETWKYGVDRAQNTYHPALGKQWIVD